MAKDSEELITRGGIWIVSFQLDGLCAGLRMLVTNGIEPGAASLQILKKLHDDWASLSTGRALAGLPRIDETLSGPEILVIAETLRATVLSFMTPEELHERKAVVGFQPEDTQTV